MTCTNHGVDSCCTECTKTTDGRGFPHSSQCKGRRPLQRCPLGCRRWVPTSEWIHDIARVIFGCETCARPLQIARDKAVMARSSHTTKRPTKGESSV